MLVSQVLKTVFYIATNTDGWCGYCHNESVILKGYMVLIFYFIFLMLEVNLFYIRVGHCIKN